MATGIQYNTKQDLIDAIIAAIFPNNKKLISGTRHQKAFLDIIESLWDQGDLVKVNVDDSTKEYLEDKLTSGDSIVLTVNDAAGVKSIEIATDGTFKTNATDTTPEYLQDKLVAGANITLNVVDTGGVKTLEIVSTDTNTDESVKVSVDDTTAGYLESKIVAGNSISLATLNPGANETLELSVDLPTLNAFYVDGNNPNPGTGSILDPYQTIDAAADAVDLAGSRITIVVRGYDGYSVERNLWANAEYVFQEGVEIVPGGGFPVGANALFDENEAGIASNGFIPFIYGKIKYTSSTKGFFHTKSRVTAPPTGADVYIEILELAVSGPEIAIDLASSTGDTVRYNITGNAGGGRGYVYNVNTSASDDTPYFRTADNGRVQFTLSNILFRDYSNNNAQQGSATLSRAMLEIGDQPNGECSMTNIKLEMNGGSVGSKSHYIQLTGSNLVGYRVNGLEIFSSYTNKNVFNIKTATGSSNSGSGFAIRNAYIQMSGAGSKFMTRTIVDAGDRTNEINGSGNQLPNFVVEGILSSVPFDTAGGATISDYIKEDASGNILVEGISYIPSGELRQIIQTAPTNPEDYVNKDYVDVRTGLSVFDTEGAAAALATGTIYRTTGGELRIKL